MRIRQATRLSLILIISITSCNQQPETIWEQYLRYGPKSGIPDFSYAGSAAGTEIPKWRQEGLEVFDVSEFGAYPDDGKDDIEGIQAAIDSASVHGGIVKLEKGVYDFDVDTQHCFLQIRSSNVILLGAGEGPDGTVIHDHTPSRTPDPEKIWLAGLRPSFVAVESRDRLEQWNVLNHPENILTGIQPAGFQDTIINVEDAKAIRVGKTYLVTMTDIDSSLVGALTAPMTKVSDYWYVNDDHRKYRFRQMVKVKSVRENQVILDSPLLWELKSAWNPQLWELPGLIENVGIAGLRFRTSWSEPFVHHKDDIHDNGWDHVKMRNCSNCFIFNVIFENATTAAGLSNCHQCEVFECQVLGNPGHNGFVISGHSTGNLLYNLKGGTQMHTWSINNYASGNVFYNCYSDTPSAVDCHGGIGVYNLFDNIYGPVYKHGGSGKYLPPSHGRGFIAWNWVMGTSEPYKNRIKQHVVKFTDSPGLIAVGLRGVMDQPLFFKDDHMQLIENNHISDWARIEYLNETPAPHSLFIEQRRQRLPTPFAGLRLR